MRAVRLFTHVDPTDQLMALARTCRSGSASNVVGVHLYSFGGVARTAAWMNARITARREHGVHRHALTYTSPATVSILAREDHTRRTWTPQRGLRRPRTSGMPAHCIRHTAPAWARTQAATPYRTWRTAQREL